MTGAVTLAELRARPERAFPREAWADTRPDEGAARIRAKLLADERRIDVERARITTESYRATEGQPMPVRRAQMLLDLARGLSIDIGPDELVVGNRSLLPRMGVIAPEGAVRWVDDELETLPTRPQDRFNIRPEEIGELRDEIFPYWQGRTLEDLAAARLPEDVRQAAAARVFGLNQTDHAQGHILPDVATWLRLGVDGLRRRVGRAQARAGGGTAEQWAHYRAAAIALDAAETFMARYARLAAARAVAASDTARAAAASDPARAVAASDPARAVAASDPARAAAASDPARAVAASDFARAGELTRLAETCAWVARHPPRDFAEAVQALWFLFVLLQMESNASSFSPGRLDQYLLPYLERDLAAGRLTLEAAQALLNHLWLKFNQIVLLRSSSSARYFAGFPIGFNIVLGGQSPDGGDATNFLSYMALRAQVDVGMTQPNLSIRIHGESPEEFLKTAAYVISRGSGMPQVFNDEVIIPGQRRRGIDARDALNYAVVGCVELSTPGRALGWSDAAMFNMTRVLELTLFGGRDPQSGQRVGLETPPLDRMARFEELEAAYDAQLAHFVDLMVRGCDVIDGIHAEALPSPFLSLVIDDCIERGVDVTAGGARYNFSGVQGVQIANVADSLAAVRQAVFEARWATGAELLTALRDDFEGHEPLRQRLIGRAPKYGNDDDAVDRLAARWAQRYCERVGRRRTVRGGVYQPGFYTVSAHAPMGAHVGATPDGRRAGQPLADGGLSPSAGRDRRGPTAVLRSVGKLNLELASNGTLLNMKFLPSLLEGDEALDKFVALLRAFCRLRIPHVQFNVVSGATLRDAQARPADYRHLVVRVAGYSAYFTELDRDLQDEIISRTEFATF